MHYDGVSKRSVHRLRNLQWRGTMRILWLSGYQEWIWKEFWQQPLPKPSSWCLLWVHDDRADDANICSSRVLLWSYQRTIIGACVCYGSSALLIVSVERMVLRHVRWFNGVQELLAPQQEALLLIVIATENRDWNNVPPLGYGGQFDSYEHLAVVCRSRWLLARMSAWLRVAHCTVSRRCVLQSRDSDNNTEIHQCWNFNDITNDQRFTLVSFIICNY